MYFGVEQENRLEAKVTAVAIRSELCAVYSLFAHAAVQPAEGKDSCLWNLQFRLL